jgi:hypothetical protein
MERVSEAHEHRREPGADPAWRETHRVDAWAADGSLGLSWSVTARPHEGRAGFLAAVLRPEELPVVLAEADAALPVARWELRTSGLWADHVCETPLDHWSYGLEAFALRVDDPAELLGRALGDRFPLGWELEFEARAEPEVLGPSAYRQSGEVHGLVLLGPAQVDVELCAVRHHWWGVHPPQGFAGVPAPGAVALPDPDGCWWVALTAEGLVAHHHPG